MKNEITVVMIGMDQWEEYTKPAIESIQKHEPHVNITVVDHGKNPYPDTPGVKIVRLANPVGYAEAMNIGISASNTRWCFVANNDILCEGAFCDYVGRMNEDVIYANKVYHIGDNIWFDSCFFFISRHVWREVGAFDPGFKIAAFEDADYSFRAQKLGFNIESIPVPFQHFEGSTRFDIPNYRDIRLENLKYLQELYPERRLDIQW